MESFHLTPLSKERMYAFPTVLFLDHSAIDRYDLAGNIRGILGAQETNHLGYLFRKAYPTHWYDLFYHIPGDGLKHLRFNQARRHDIDPNTETSHLRGKGSTGSFKTCLGC